MEAIRRNRNQPRRAACQRCHHRKAKCNSFMGEPCNSCQSARVECIPYERRRRNHTSPPQRSSSRLPSILPAADDEELSTRERSRAGYTSSDTRDITPLPSTRDTRGHRHEAGRNNRGDSQQSNQNAADTLSFQAGIQRHLVEMLSQEDIDRLVIRECDRTIYVGQEFSNINYLIHHRIRNADVHHFPDNPISRLYMNQRSEKIPQEAFYLPPSAVVDNLLDSYFRHVNPGFPIIDQEVFMRRYRARNAQDPPSLLVLQAVLLVGSHVSRRLPDRDELKSAFFRRTKMLFDGRVESKRDAMVQAALLLMWHCDGIEDVSDNAYYWLSTAVHIAFGIGMHRDTRSSTIVAEDRRVWRRLWWIIVQFDVLMTLSLGRPQAINLDDADVPPLSTGDFEGLEGNVDKEFVTSHADLCVIASRGLRERFGIHVPAARKMAALQTIDRQLTQWKANLPSKLRHRSTENISTWSAILQISYNNLLIILHRPSPSTVDASPAQTEDIGKTPSVLKKVYERFSDAMLYYTAEICSSAASILVTLFSTLHRWGELRCMNVFAVNSLFTTLIQLSAEMRGRNPLLSADATYKFDTAIEVLGALSEYWLNARVVNRLFEDSSEALQEQLRIGKSRNQSVHASAPSIEPPSNLGDVQWSEMNTGSQGESSNANAGAAPDGFDWSLLYWQNPGLNVPSLFGELGNLDST